MAQVENIEKTGNVLMKLVEHFKKYWLWWILMSLFAFIVAIMATFIRMVNSDDIFERYDKYVEMKHQCSNNYRIETAPTIVSCLNNLVNETNADEAFVMEFHNGKNNPSGLQWQYVDMTFISDDCEDVRDEFQNVSGVRYPLSNVLHDNGYFIGSREDIDKVDHRLALRLEANGVEYVAFMMMYDTNATDLGFVGVAYMDKSNVNVKTIKKTMSRYALIISPYLDISNAKVKNNKSK